MEHILRLGDDAITALARGQVGAAVFIDPSNSQVKLSQFADDLGMWTFASSNPFLVSKTLADLEKWCAKWRIKLNAKKT